MDVPVWWVSNVRPSEKETCDLLDLLFCSPWLLHTWLLFSNPPVKYDKAEGSLISATCRIENKVPLLDNVEGHCWRVGPRCQNPWTIRVLSGFYFGSPWMLATRLLFLNPPMKFDLIKYGWQTLLTCGSQTICQKPLTGGSRMSDYLKKKCVLC
jgi:hypothetical protein